MAEIILEPTVQSKVIPLSIRLNDTDTSLVSQLVTNRQFSTADTDAWFSFTLEGLAATTGTFDLTLINLQDKSVFNHTDKVFSTNPFYYKLDSGTDELTNEIRHAGKWVGQFVVTLANGDSATRKFIFGIEGHILDGTVVQTILLEDYNALIASIESAKDELTQYNIDYASLIGTVTEQEAARSDAEELRVITDALRETKEDIRQATFEANEVIRDGVVDSAIEGEMISQTVATKLAEKEATFAPRMLSLESELADIHWDMLELGCIGDGVHDDSVIIQNVIDGAEKGDTIFFPNTSGGYRTTETIIVNKPLNVIFKGYLKIDHADIGIQFKDNSSNGSFNQDYHNTIFNEGTLRVKRVRNSIYDTSSTAINIDLVNVYSGNFFISESSGGHTGLRLLGDSYGTGFPGSTYNMITIAYIVSSVISILLETKNNGYVTQNQFYGGSLTGGLLTEDTIHVDMRNNGSSEMNENIFYGLSLEGSKKTAIKGNNARNNRFIACRFEMPHLEMLFDFESSTYNEILTGLYVDNAMRDSKFNDNDESRKEYWTMTKVSYSDYELGSIEYFDRIFYVKPKNNMLGRYNQYNNTITKSDGKWTDVRILSSGMGSVTIYTSESNTIEGKEKIDISIHDEIYVSHSATGIGFDEIQLTNPPNYSKEFIITRENGHVDVLLSVDDSIDSLIGDTIIPQGTSNIKLYYNYRANTVRVLSVF